MPQRRLVKSFGLLGRLDQPRDLVGVHLAPLAADVDVFVERLEPLVQQVVPRPLSSSSATS
jgi:hypothetical protein